MHNHLDEMKLFLDLVQSYSKNILLENEVKEEVITENTENTENIKNVNEIQDNLVTDLVELKEAWLSISSDNCDESYSMGYEQGLYKAVEMLENMLNTKYNRRI